ncbi:replicative DNA helicase [Streptomyces sp. NPDC092307]|uniref:replicative DNA helicase n=1 Tax=Streptomyces sp. NPDC092307 TaxID=3366013 RepID=UPI0038235D1B
MSREGLPQNPAQGGPVQQRLDKVPPHSIDAEMSTLGGQMLLRTAIVDVMSSQLQLRDYYRPGHEKIQSAILDLYRNDQPVDPITLAAELTKRGEISRIGGPPYLHMLVDAVPTAANASYYAEIVHECAVLRRLIQAGMRITGWAYEACGNLDDVRSAVEGEILDALKGGGKATPYSYVRSDVPCFWDGLDAKMKGSDTSKGLRTGFYDLDVMTNGLQPGQLVVVGARPAVGKSTFALDITRACAVHHGGTAVFFSLEMGRSEIVQRLYSAEARVALHHIRAGSVSEDDLARMAARTPAIEGAPLIVDDSSDLSLVEIRSRARQIKQSKGGLDLVVVDYLQLLHQGSGRRRPESRQQEVAEMSRDLKLLAKELEVPVVALSQLNRGVEQRVVKRPVVSDLRESGSIEQDADLVILLHREDVSNPGAARSGEADLIVAKHRNGPTGTVTVGFQGHYSRFVDMART